MTSPNPVRFEAPPLNPSPNGLFAATVWGPTDIPRWMISGVEIKGPNYGGEQAFGVWNAPWCGMIVEVWIDAASGTWTFTVDGQTTGALAYDITSTNLRNAIVALSNVDADDVSVSGFEGGHFVTFTRRREFDIDDASLDGTGRAGETLKFGERPDVLDPFEAMTVWAYDECDLTAPSRKEVDRRAPQILRLEEQVAVEHEFANRLLTDAGTPDNVDDLVLAIGFLEAQLALTNTVGFIHVGAQWAAVAASSQVLTKSGTKLTTPLGHTLVFGGGYVNGLENTLVATSQPFGWRTEAETRSAIDERHNTYAAIAERSVLVGYEAVIAAATIT